MFNGFSSACIVQAGHAGSLCEYYDLFGLESTSAKACLPKITSWLLDLSYLKSVNFSNLLLTRLRPLAADLLLYLASVVKVGLRD